MTAGHRGAHRAETDAEREERYFAGYRAIPDGEDEEFKAITRLALDMLEASEE